MTDNEIIKGLEEWSERGMSFCNVSMSEFARHILALINRQKAEIDYWKKNAFDGCMERGRICEAARAEAIKEFAERIQRHCTSIELNAYIDNLVEERVGADK